MTKRKPCQHCPWVLRNWSANWRRFANGMVELNKFLTVQGCHDLSDDQQIPCPDRQKVCVGHLQQRLDYFRDHPEEVDEEVLQELCLLDSEN